MFKEEYKKAYDEMKADNGSVDEILKQAKFRNSSQKPQRAWKPAIATLLLTITLIAGICFPTFVQAIERMTSILDTGAIDYTYYKSLQRENPEWTENAFIPYNATAHADGIIMKVELATFCKKDFIAIISFANEEGYNWIREDGEYHYYNISVKIGENVPQFRSMKFMKFDNEKLYYLYTAKRHTAQIPESETVSIEVHGIFESTEWEESVDLSNVASTADTRVVQLQNSHVDETLVTLENREYPYTASVLNMTPVSEIKTYQATVTGLAYADGILRIQTAQPDSGVSDTTARLAYVYFPQEKVEQLIWYEKIDGQLMLFMEDYYKISEESLNTLPMTMKCNEKIGAYNATWKVSFEVEKN